MITFPDKTEGDKIYPEELNAIKLGINEQLTRLQLIDGDGTAYASAFGSIANRIESIEQYLMLLTQHNAMMSQVLSTALPEVFKFISTQEDVDVQQIARDAAAQAVAGLQAELDQAAEEEKAQVQARLDAAKIERAEAEAKLDKLIDGLKVEKETEVKSDEYGDYVGNQLYIKWPLTYLNDEKTLGVEDIDQDLLDRYQLKPVVEMKGEKGVQGMALYQAPKGTDIKAVIEAISQEQNMQVLQGSSRAIAKESPEIEYGHTQKSYVGNVSLESITTQIQADEQGHVVPLFLEDLIAEPYLLKNILDNTDQKNFSILVRNPKKLSPAGTNEVYWYQGTRYRTYFLHEGIESHELIHKYNGQNPFAQYNYYIGSWDSVYPYLIKKLPYAPDYTKITGIRVNRNTQEQAAINPGYVTNEIFIRWNDENYPVTTERKTEILNEFHLDLKREFLLSKSSLYTIRDGAPYPNAQVLKGQLTIKYGGAEIKYADTNNTMTVASR